MKFKTTLICALFLLAGCLSTGQPTIPSNLSDQDKNIALKITEKAAQYCTTGGYDPVTNKPKTNFVNVGTSITLNKLYRSTDTSWYKADLVIKSIWDSVYYDDATGQIVCGDRMWGERMLQDPKSRITFEVAGGAASARELFVNKKLIDIKQGDLVALGTTIGGYPFYDGGESWTFSEGRVRESIASGDGSVPVVFGDTTLKLSVANMTVARQTITVNLGNSKIKGRVDESCQKNALIVRNLGDQFLDRCMSITAGDDNGHLYLGVHIVNSADSGRVYVSDFAILPEVLGAHNTKLADWQRPSSKWEPKIKVVMKRLNEWAESVQDATIKAINQEKPLDAFSNALPIVSLLPVPADLSSGDHGSGFLATVEIIRYKKGFGAIAYSQYAPHRTSYGSAWGKRSQEEADSVAMANCKKFRKEGAPLCEFYRFERGLH